MSVTDGVEEATYEGFRGVQTCEGPDGDVRHCMYRPIASLDLRPIRKPMTKPQKVIFSDPATICLWPDGTKTVVKCHEGDEYGPQTGLLMCVAKKAYGNDGSWYDVVKDSGALDEQSNESLVDFANCLTETLRRCYPHVDDNPAVLDHDGNHIHVGDVVRSHRFPDSSRQKVASIHHESRDSTHIGPWIAYESYRQGSYGGWDLARSVDLVTEP